MTDAAPQPEALVTVVPYTDKGVIAMCHVPRGFSEAMASIEALHPGAERDTILTMAGDLVRARAQSMSLAMQQSAIMLAAHVGADLKKYVAEKIEPTQIVMTLA